MKNEKGITLISLVLYITVLLIIVAIVGTISSNFYNNMKKIKTNATNLDDYNKFISFFLEDIKREQNSIVSINNTNTEIVFTTGNTYSFDAENFQIKFNDLVIVNNVTACTFVAISQEEKTIVTVSITIDGNNYSTQYSTKLSNNYKTYIAEKEYVKEIEFPIPENAFAIKVEVQAGDSITLPTYNKSGFQYDFTVNYGDGTGKYEITSYNDADRIHTYTEAGTYKIIITGTCNGWSFYRVPTSCTKVTEIVQWGDVSLIDFSFRNCTNLTGEVTFPEGIVNIPGTAFAGCTGLTGNLVIPETVRTIENGGYTIWGAFSGCIGLTGNIVFPEEMTFIGSYAFYGCTGFTGNISLPENITIIREQLFNGCTGLDGTLTFGEKITGIQNSAFRLTKLKVEGNINLPLCTAIAGSAFSSGPTGNGNWNLPECITIGDYYAIPQGVIGLNIPKVTIIRI